MEIAFTIPPASLIKGRFTGNPDGDGVFVSLQLRIHGIDAPEYGQEYYTESTEALTALCCTCDPLSFTSKGVDAHGRILATVMVGGRDVGKELVRRGWAWSITSDYAEEEQEARKKHRGLWKAKNPIPPWEFRKTDKFARAKDQRRWTY